MEYNFIKEIYKSVVSELGADDTTLYPFIGERENAFILKHNITALSLMLRFLNSPDNIFILNGFTGAGKTAVTDCLLDFVSEDVLIFKNSYQEAINLDDVLLSMFKDFYVYQNEQKVILPKTDSVVFSEKINAYVKNCNSPMLFVFDSFEINMRSKDTQKDILDFINYLSRFEKVKIIICSRSFTQDELLFSGSAASYSLKSLTKDEVLNYLKENEIASSPYELEELYKVSRGHYLLIELSVLIMKMLDTSLTLFSSEYKKSAKNFPEFLVSKILSVSSDKFIKLILFLALIRHGVTGEFLLNRNIAVGDDIPFLLQKHVISEKFSKYYLKDYIKSEFIKSVNAPTRIKVHKYLTELYESELPLKPFDRELFLSRLTMRQEISYHKSKIESIENEYIKAGKSKPAETGEVPYLSYSKTSGYDETAAKKSSNKRYIKNIRMRKAENHRKFELSDEDSLFLNTASQKDTISEQMYDISLPADENPFGSEPMVEVSEEIPETIDDYIQIAKEYEDAYNFADAIMYYKKALTYTDETDFEEKEPVIYSKLALCYKKIQDSEEAVRLYEKVYGIYLAREPQKAAGILLNIAQIFAEIYKFDKAKEYYKKVLFSPAGVSEEMRIRVYLSLAELDDYQMDLESALEYAQKAITESEKLADTGLIAECYFKYALLLDDSNNTEIAVKYYLRCIQISNDVNVNKNLSSAYFNLAELSMEKNNSASAKMYYELAINADKTSNNYEGLYYSYSKLAELYKNVNSEKRYEMLVKALSAAKRFDDISYTVAVYIELGCFYYDSNDYKQALKSFILAKNLAPKNGQEDYITKINEKIAQIKSIAGDIEYSRLLSEIKKKR